MKNPVKTPQAAWIKAGKVLGKVFSGKYGVLWGIKRKCPSVHPLAHPVDYEALRPVSPARIELAFKV